MQQFSLADQRLIYNRLLEAQSLGSESLNTLIQSIKDNSSFKDLNEEDSLNEGITLMNPSLRNFLSNYSFDGSLAGIYSSIQQRY